MQRRCELLSKVYIFDIRNNLWWHSKQPYIVVNCFQKFISLIFETTYSQLISSLAWLWIAFKSLYLWYSKQLHIFSNCYNPCCELLSKVYIFDIRNNMWRYCKRFFHVVNCFQKFISLIFETTMPLKAIVLNKLWIAFKSLYLWYSKQP